MRALLLTAVTTFGLDQLTKWFVVQWLDLLSRGEIDVFPPLINFRMAWNQGVNFGLFSNSTDIVRWVLIAVALVISGWVILWVQREKMRRLAQVSAGVLVGGGLGDVGVRVSCGAGGVFLNISGFGN